MSRAAELDSALYGPTVASAATGDALAFVALVLRFLARRIDGQSLWYDDYLVIPSMAVTLAASFTSWATFGNNRIPGNDPLVLSAEMRTRFLKVYYLYQALGLVGRGCFKLSILALLLRMFRKHKIYCRVVLFVIGVVTIWMITFSLASLFQCRPVQKLWDPAIPGACIDPTIMVGTIDISNVALGLTVAGLTSYRVLSLDAFKRRRGSFATLSLFGFFVLAFGCALAYFDIFQLMPFFVDKVYSLDGSTMFYLLEINGGIVVACLATLPPVFELCCAPRSRKDTRLSRSSSHQDWKDTTELDADDGRVELGDPGHAAGAGVNSLHAELFGSKINRGELQGTILPMELPTCDMTVEIDGREICHSNIFPVVKQHSWREKALPIVPPAGNFF